MSALFLSGSRELSSKTVCFILFTDSQLSIRLLFIMLSLFSAHKVHILSPRTNARITKQTEIGSINKTNFISRLFFTSDYCQPIIQAHTQKHAHKYTYIHTYIRPYAHTHTHRYPCRWRIATHSNAMTDDLDLDNSPDVAKTNKKFQKCGSNLTNTLEHDNP